LQCGDRRKRHCWCRQHGDQRCSSKCNRGRKSGTSSAKDRTRGFQTPAKDRRIMNNTIPFLDLIAAHAELEEELVTVFRSALKTAGFIGGPMVENFETAF